MSEQANTYREGSPYAVSTDTVESDTVTASQLLEVLGVNVEDSTNNIVVYDSATQEVTADVNSSNVQASTLLSTAGVNIEDSTNAVVIYDSSTQEVTADVNATNVAASNGLIDVYEDFTPQTAAPTHSKGRIALADGTNWDPDADGSGELVISDGTTWVEIANLGTTL